MTAARHQRKWRGVTAIASAILAAVVASAQAEPYTTTIGTTERIVLDWHTGLAINGFDPVAYFTDVGPSLGRPEFEYPYQGAVWRFRNVGNRSAFMGHPDIYMPRYGGYDPVRVAGGVAVPGHPTLWLVHADRLYLFYSAEDRLAFSTDPERFLAPAERKWPEIVKTLAP